MNKWDRRYAEKIEKVRALLAADGAVADRTKLELVLGLAEVNVRVFIKRAKADGVIRVARWRDEDACCTGRETYTRPYYALGGAPDAPRPVFSSKEACKLYRRRLKRNRPEQYTLMRAKRNAKDRVVRADPLVQALFGAGR